MAIDYTAYAGDDLQIQVTVTDEDGDPSVLAGSDAIYVISRNGTAKVTKTTGGGDITIDGNDFVVTIDAADTVALSGTYHHELKYVSAFDGLTYTVLYGDVVFLPTVVTDVTP